MKILNFKPQPFNQLLIEANVYNIKDEYENASIAKFIEKFQKDLPEEIGAAFAKKMKKLLLAADEFLFQIKKIARLDLKVRINISNKFK